MPVGTPDVWTVYKGGLGDSLNNISIVRLFLREDNPCGVSFFILSFLV